MLSFMNFRTIAILASFSSTALFSQDDSGPVPLDQVDVTASRPAPLTVPSLMAADAAIKLTPGGVETIDSSRWLRGRASTVDDTFALSPGVIALSRFGSDEARLSIRGSGLQRTFHGRGIRVIQDGVPLNLADGGFDMQALEPLAADYIQVWRGGNALALGASTLGGAIEYVSRTGRIHSTPAMRLEAGSWDYLRVNASAGGFSKSVDGYASLTHQSQSGYRDHSRQRNVRLFTNAGIAIAPGIETRIYLTGVRTDSELPGNLTKAQASTHPTLAASDGIALNQRRDFDLIRVASKTTISRSGTVWDIAAAWTYKDLDHPIFQIIDQLSNDLLLSATVSGNADWFSRSVHWRSGLLFQRGLTQAANFVNARGSRGALLATSDQTAANLEAFAEGRIPIGNGLELILGASAADNRRKSDQTFGGTNDYDLAYHRIMPKVGLRWDRSNAQFFANFSGSYEPPSFSETLTLNTARSAQTASSWEIGGRGSLGPVRWDATAYRARVRSELLSLDHDNNPLTPSATVNADATLHSGLEVGVAADLLGNRWADAEPPLHRLVLRAAWTVSDLKFNGDPRYGNNKLAGIPPDLIRGELAWETSGGWHAGPTLQWAPKRTFIDFRNTYAADPYAIVGLRVGRQTGSGFSWFAELRNVFDTKYVATTGVIENAKGADQPQFLPGDGRGLYAGLSYAY